MTEHSKNEGDTIDIYLSVTGPKWVAEVTIKKKAKRDYYSEPKLFRYFILNENVIWMLLHGAHV